MRDSVLIVGAGPVGLSLALALARRGIAVRVFEAQAELSSEARASTLHPPTLEMLAEWGAAEAVIARGLRVNRLQYWERVTRKLVAEFDYALIADATPYPFRLQCPQSVLTLVLLPALEATGRAQVHFSHRLVGFDDCGDHVVAYVETPDGARHFHGDFLCGADGAHSTVRKQLGLSFEGMTYADRFLLIGTDYDFGAIFPGLGPVAYIFDPEEWVIVMQQRDGVRVIFRFHEHKREEAVLCDEAIEARFRRLGATDPLPPIRSRSIYSVHRRIASAFRVGRVVLLGDAAHINNPTGGMGMNSGIHDAHALATRLARAFQPGSDWNALLDEYAAERRAAALDLVQQRSDHNARDMSAADAAYRAERNRRLRAWAADPTQARAFLLRASMLDVSRAA